MFQNTHFLWFLFLNHASDFLQKLFTRAVRFMTLIFEQLILMFLILLYHVPEKSFVKVDAYQTNLFVQGCHCDWNSWKSWKIMSLYKLYWLEKLEKKFMKHDVVVVVVFLFLITQN